MDIQESLAPCPALRAGRASGHFHCPGPGIKVPCRPAWADRRARRPTADTCGGFALIVRIADTTPEDPFALFAAWLEEAGQKEPNDPNAMALATVGEDGLPSLRMVLLKGYDAEGFVFYTNLESRKGRQLEANPKAALLFHWKSLRRQVRVEGPVSPVGAAEADDYFASRPRQSQIGAWASDQARPLEGRFEL